MRIKAAIVFGLVLFALLVWDILDTDNPDDAPQDLNRPKGENVVIPNQDQEETLKEPDPEIEPLTTEPRAQSNSILGKVLDSKSRAPIPYAEIFWLSKKADGSAYEINRMKTDETGGFLASNLPMEQSFICFTRARGYAVKNRWLFVNKNQMDMKIHLDPGGVIQGRLIDKEQAPINKARLEVYSWNKYSIYSKYISDSKLNMPQALDFLEKEILKDGCFTIHNLPEGEYVIIAHAPGRLATQSDPVKPGVTDLTIVMETGGSQIGGWVLNKETRKPMPGKKIRLLGVRFFSQTQSDSKGRFFLFGIPAGEYILKAWPNAVSYADPIKFQLNGKEEKKDIKLLFQKGVSVSGIAVDAVTKIPCSRIKLRIFSQKKQYNMIGCVRKQDMLSNEDGAFFFSGPFEPGPYLFLFHRKGARQYKPIEKIEITEKNKDSVVLLIREKPQITGKVIDGIGNPIQKALVIAVPQNHEKKIMERTNESGFFSFDGLVPDSYQLQVEHSNCQKEILEDLIQVTKETQQSGFVIQLKKLSVLIGTVHDAKGGVIAGANVSGYNRNAVANTYFSEKTDAEGHYKLQKLYPGANHITAKAEGYLAQTRRISIKNPGSEFREDFYLESSYPISGVLLDQENQPCERFILYCIQENEKSTSVSNTKKDGSFTFPCKANALYRICIDPIRHKNIKGVSSISYRREKDFITLKENVKSGTHGLVLRLSREILSQNTMIIGSVCDTETMAPLAKANVYYRFKTTKNSSIGGNTYADEEGVFQILAQKGEVKIWASVKGYVTTFLPPFNWSGDEKVHDLLILMGKNGVSITFKVMDAMGVPVQGASVGMLGNQKTLTNNNGHALLHQMNPIGGEMVAVQKKKYKTAYYKVTKNDASSGVAAITLKKSD